MKVSAELISSQDCEEESAYASFLASGGFAGHLHSSLACGSIDSISAFTWCSQAVCVCLNSPFYQDICHIGCGLMVVTLFYPDYLCKGDLSYLQVDNILRQWGLGLEHMTIWGWKGVIQSMIRINFKNHLCHFLIYKA